MSVIFISSCRIDAPPAASLVNRLREESFYVIHSPRNPSDGGDARRRNWYEKRCRDEMEQANIFIAVISQEWNCSTWMAHEAHEALELIGAGKIQGLYFWNPDRVEVRAPGMSPYLKERLPDDLNELVRVLSENKSDKGKS
ncbi:MAG: toll/interleukin-1 receptor domain-containing protein [Pyrinomonadaceae bacterium]|nr:toll/interleukin-1 receptor domain-containing protein [Pyrinomonadaceae bacterium]